MLTGLTNMLFPVSTAPRADHAATAAELTRLYKVQWQRFADGEWCASVAIGQAKAYLYGMGATPGEALLSLARCHEHFQRRGSSGIYIA